MEKTLIENNESQESSYEKRSKFSGREGDQPPPRADSELNKVSFCGRIQVQIHVCLGEMSLPHAMSVWGRWGYLKSTGLSIIAGTVQRGQGLKGVSFFMGRHSGRVISHPWHWFFLCHWSSYLTSLWYWAESLWGPETVCWTLCCRKRPWFCVQVATNMNPRKRCIWVLSALGHLVHSQMFIILPTIR